MEEAGDLGQFSVSQQESGAKGAALDNATDIKVCVASNMPLIVPYFMQIAFFSLFHTTTEEMSHKNSVVFSMSVIAFIQITGYG